MQNIHNITKGMVIFMIKVQKYLGNVKISDRYIKSLIGHAVNSCFGVVKMNSYGTLQDLASFFKLVDPLDMGVFVNQRNNGLLIDLHLVVSYGVNISAISDSISHKVKYVVEEETGLKVEKIKVYIDSIIA